MGVAVPLKVGLCGSEALANGVGVLLGLPLAQRAHQQLLHETVWIMMQHVACVANTVIKQVLSLADVAAAV